MSAIATGEYPREILDIACRAYNDQSMQLADAQYVCMNAALKAIAPLLAAQPELTASEVEWIEYAVEHMLDDSEPEDKTCAVVLRSLLDRSLPAQPVAQPIVVTEGRPEPHSSPQFVGLDRLLTFYDVTNVSDLVTEMERHILKLQEKNRQLDPRVERFQPVPRA